MIFHRIGIGLLALEVLLVLIFLLAAGGPTGFWDAVIPAAYLAVPAVLLLTDDRRAPSRVFTATAWIFLLLPVALVLLVLLVSASGVRLVC